MKPDLDTELEGLRIIADSAAGAEEAVPRHGGHCGGGSRSVLWLRSFPTCSTIERRSFR